MNEEIKVYAGSTAVEINTDILRLYFSLVANNMRTDMSFDDFRALITGKGEGK